MLAALRFLWNSTRGHHFRPWRSPYVRWRIETFSGLHAEEITFGVFLRFVWRERGRLLHFLHWCGEMSYFRRHMRHPAQSSWAGPE
jgi:hypothetical protein